jgi:hypothetical protein
VQGTVATLIKHQEGSQFITYGQEIMDGPTSPPEPIKHGSIGIEGTIYMENYHHVPAFYASGVKSSGLCS